MRDSDRGCSAADSMLPRATFGWINLPRNASRNRLLMSLKNAPLSSPFTLQGSALRSLNQSYTNHRQG